MEHFQVEPEWLVEQRLLVIQFDWDSADAALAKELSVVKLVRELLEVYYVSACPLSNLEGMILKASIASSLHCGP